MSKNLLFEWGTKKEYITPDGVKHMEVVVEVWDPEVFMGWVRDVDLDFTEGESLDYHHVKKKIIEALGFDDFS